MVEDEKDQRTYTEYLLQVRFNGQNWTIPHKYKDFFVLHESLINSFPSVQFPKSSQHFQQISVTELDARTSNSSYITIEERKKVL